MSPLAFVILALSLVGSAAVLASLAVQLWRFGCAWWIGDETIL